MAHPTLSAPFTDARLDVLAAVAVVAVAVAVPPLPEASGSGGLTSALDLWPVAATWQPGPAPTQAPLAVLIVGGELVLIEREVALSACVPQAVLDRVAVACDGVPGR